jgi:hypothetical protein
MPYAIQKPVNIAKSKKITLGAIEGQNNATLQQLLNTNQATEIVNYLIREQGKIEKRKGSKTLGQVTSNLPGLIILDFNADYIIFGYGTVLASINKSTGSITSIKTDFITNLEDIVRYGAYAYSCNGTGNKIYRTYLALDYDGQSANFAVGQILTGGTSGATALIVYDADAGATGTLTLDNISGTFQNNEAITDSATGAAVANGVVKWVTEEISGSPYCTRLAIYEKRLIAGNIVKGSLSAPWRAIASDEDTVAPYFDSWTQLADATKGFLLDYGKAGELTDIAIFDQSDKSSPAQIVIFYKDGYASFLRTVSDIGGTMSQDLQTFFDPINAGGERGANTTPFGIHFGNENGEYLLQRDGRLINLTSSFGDFSLINNTNSDRVYLERYNILLTTTAYDSDKNNIIYWFDTRTLNKKVSWGMITGLSIARFVKSGDKVYGISSNSPKIIELFPDNIYDDDGSPVEYKYKQPMNVGSLDSLKDLVRVDIGAFLTSNQPININFDAIPEGGGSEEDVVSYELLNNGGSVLMSGYGSSGYGTSGYVSTPENNGLLWTTAYGDSKKAYGYMLYILKIQGIDTSPHIISFVSIDTVEQRRQRSNLLT